MSRLRLRLLLLVCLLAVAPGLVGGCGGAALPPVIPPPAELEATVEAKQVGEGEAVILTVEAAGAEGWSLAVGQPTAEGLDVQLLSEAGPVAEGNRAVRSWRYALTGPAGSYIITVPPGQATSPEGEVKPLEIAPIFVDIGVRGPLAEGLADFQAEPPPQAPPYGLYAALAAGALALAIGIPLLIRATRKPPPPPAPVPPHVQARADWAAVRGAGLDDHPQAIALSKVLRAYFEAITGWPATMRTGPEILAWLRDERIAGPTAILHAERILSATDRLKFAREGGGAWFFADLDRDFDAVVEATRPAAPEPAAPAAPEPAAPEPAAPAPAPAPEATDDAPTDPGGQP